MQYSAAALVVAFGFIVFHEWGKAVHRRLDALNEKMADLSSNAKRQTELPESIRNGL